jgi:hypothetical protein
VSETTVPVVEPTIPTPTTPPITPTPIVELDKSPILSIGDSENIEPPSRPDDKESVPDPEKKHRINPDDIQERFLSLLNVDMKELDTLSEHYPKFDGTAGESGKAWFAAYLQGLNHLLRGNSLSDSVVRAESAWRQKVAVDGESLAAGRPRFGSAGGNGNIISGERALMKATSLLGLGAVVQIPLWHTGIWVSLKSPSEAALLELERRIASEKVSLGRYTSGMIFSHTSVYTVSYVVNFVLNHVYDASVKNITQDALKQLIKITDIPTLVWGLACAIYPNGYKYTRPCTTNPAECQHIVTGELNIAKLSWTDNNSLTDWQRRQMAKRTEKFSEADLKRYEQEHHRGGDFTIPLTEALKVKLRVPTITQYEQSGFTWVDGIVKLLEGSLGVSLKGKERDDYITDQGRLTALRQYSHWVNRIEVGDDAIEDQETIEALLGTLSSDEKISKVFFESVGKYIDNSTLSVIAIPKYDCPKCGGEQTGDIHANQHPHLLPLDVVRIFFTLLDQRIFKALTNRQL